MVARDTVTHVQRPYLDGQTAQLLVPPHVAMAGGALESRSYVRLVHEPHVVRQSMHSGPVKRLLLLPGQAQLVELAALVILANDLVAEHALLLVWIAGRRTVGHCAVAKGAVQPVANYVRLVRKVDWLRARYHWLRVDQPGRRKRNKPNTKC